MPTLRAMRGAVLLLLPATVWAGLAGPGGPTPPEAVLHPAGARAPRALRTRAPRLHGVPPPLPARAAPREAGRAPPAGPAAPAPRGAEEAPARVARRYPLPPLCADLEGWRVQGRLGAWPSGALVAPAGVPALLEAALPPTLWSAAAGSARADGLAGALEVIGTPALHEALAALLRSTAWTPEWLGADLAARELAELLERGLPAERGWGQAAWTAASSDRRAAVERERARIGAAGGEAEPPVGDLAPLASCLRVFALPRETVGDLLDVRHMGLGYVSPPPAPWAPLSARSKAALLDDCQLSALIRVSEKCPERVPTLLTRDGTAREGEEQAVPLGEHGWLRLTFRRRADRPALLDLWLSCRSPGPGGLRFVPVGRHALPEGGTLFLTVDDTLEPAAEPEAVLALVLTLEAVPASDGEVLER